MESATASAVSTRFDRLRNLSVPGVLAEVAAADESKLAIVDGDVRLTYGELLSQSRCLAAGLRSAGVEPGDRVGLCLPNWHEFVVSYFGIGAVGGVVVPINTRYSAREADHYLRDSGAKILITAGEFAKVDLLGMYRDLQPTLPELETLVVVRPVAELRADEVAFADLVAFDRPVELPEVDPQEDLFAILYTSGTTGVPKGAMLRHRNIVQINIATAELMQMTPEDVFLVPVPMSHIFGMGPSIMTAIASGASMVLMEMYKPEPALELIERERVTVHHGVPTMFIMELNSPDLERRDVSSLRTGIIAAAPCPIEVVKAIREKMGCEICVSFGQTESSPSLTSTRFEDSDEDRAETVGQAMPGVELRIVGDDSNDVGPGGVGEILARGPGVMKGYFRRPEETNKALSPDGWLATGDLGQMDERGFLKIVGRKKELIIRGGYNIYPREVEELIYQHPAVLEAAAVSVDDEVMGERTCLCVRRKSDCEVSAEELQAYCTESLAKYKVPDFVEFFDEFPTTASGKIMKRELRTLVHPASGE